MPIEILIILSAAFSFISLAILLFQSVRKDRKEGEEAMFLRAMQEMQDKLSSSMNSFRSSLEQRLQACCGEKLRIYRDQQLIGGNQGIDAQIVQLWSSVHKDVVIVIAQRL